jgi:ATP-dependent protease HslVU (ClpYQ) peptidase subunit
MSVVAVKITEKEITISADSQVSCGRSNKLEGREKNPAKLFRVNNGKIIFGSTGWTDIASLFRLYCETRQPEYSSELAILNFLSEFFDWAHSKNSDFKLENSFVIIFNKKVFVTHGFEVNEVDTYSAIGSGMFLALGAMYMGADTQKAIDVAKKYDLYCGGETVSFKISL